VPGAAFGRIVPGWIAFGSGFAGAGAAATLAPAPAAAAGAACFSAISCCTSFSSSATRFSSSCSLAVCAPATDARPSIATPRASVTERRRSVEVARA
jgi:hypothetical protein